MEFLESYIGEIKTLNATDKIYFGKPKKRYYCPCCKKERRKVVLSFHRVDLAKDIIKGYNFNLPFCETCFELNYGSIMNDFYGTNIY